MGADPKGLDFFEDREPGEADLTQSDLTDSRLGRLSYLATTQIQLENRIKEIEALLESNNQTLTKIRTEEIPTLMQELGLSKIVTRDGHVLELKDIINASIPKDEPRRSNALQWLRDQGYGDLIKNQVAVVFGKGEDQKAEVLIQKLEGEGLEPQRTVTVNFQSLSALIRTLRKEGKNVDSENLSVYEAKISKIKRK